VLESCSVPTVPVEIGRHEVIRGVALLVGDPQRQSLKNLAIKFDVPGGAAGDFEVRRLFCSGSAGK